MRPPSSEQTIIRLMAFQALTLAIASTLHLSSADVGAGLAEALICVALVFGATALASGRRWGQTAALTATGFAILGFLLGLTLTLRGGDAADVAYHASMLPLFVITAIQLSRLRQPHPRA
jgi:hypothetical protein